MNPLLLECREFLGDFEHPYAFCGGYALELFTGRVTRTHSDLDVTLLRGDRRHIIAYLQAKGWDVYEPMHATKSLRLIRDPHDEGIENRLYIWAIKPGCTLIRMEPSPGRESVFRYSIMDGVQRNFDFIDITFNPGRDGSLVCDESKNIARSLDKAILYQGGTPYLAPEVILFWIANPAYVESDYHRAKNNLDWESTPPFLPKESLEWLVTSLKAAYPDGNRRLDGLLALRAARS